MGLTDEAVEASDSMDKFVQTMQFAGIDNSKIEESKTVMKDYADQTVYELGDVMNTTAQLAANGVKDFDGLTQAIGNVNAVSGGNSDTFKSVAMAMTQTVGAGKLTTENFNQIADAIPGASGKIQQALKQMGAYTDGDFREAMANGEISAEELNEAFMQLGMTDVAKKAAGSTATIEGAVGNLQASAVNMINEIINAFGKGNITSLISDIGKGIDDLTTKIKPAMESIKNVAQPVFDMLKKGADIATLAFGTLFGTLDGDQAKQGFDILTKIFPPEMVTFAQDTIEKIKNAVKTLFDVFKGKADMGDVLTKLGFSPETISKIKNVFDNLKTYFDGTMATIKNGIAIGWEIVKGIFDTLSPYIMPIIEKIGGAFSKIGKSMTTFWNENGKQIIEAIKNFFTFIQPVVKIVMDLVMGFIDNIIGLVEGIMNVIQGAIKIFTGLFTGDFSKMWEGVKQLFWGSIQAVWNWIQILFFKRILEGVKGLWTGFSGSIKGLWESTKTFFTEGISNTWDKLVNWVMNLLSKAGNLKTTFGDFIKNMWNSVKNFFSNDASAVGTSRNCFVPFVTRLTKGKTYTLSVSMMIDDEFADSQSYASSPLNYTIYTNNPAKADRPVDIYPSADMRNQWKRVSKVFTMPVDQKDGDYIFLQWWQGAEVKGKLYVRYDIMIQEGDQTSSQTAAWRPNLLDAPYYLSKVALGENIANKSVAFPIKSSAFNIYEGNMEEDFMIGQTYTITLKGTKPATQDFWVFNSGDVSLGKMKPVEGLSDIWTLTFTPNAVNSSTPKLLAIYQTPQSTAGACQIDWLKIEKGDTRTPNISQFKYFGEGLKDSNNPNDYSWDVTPEYTEKGLNDAVNVYDPQRVEGLKNFADGIQIAGDKVISENDCTVYTLTKDNSQSFIDGYATFTK